MKRRSFLTYGSLALLALIPMGVTLRALAEETEKPSGFDSLPASQKDLVKKNWDRFKSFSPEKQKELEATFAEMQKLTPEQKKKIQENYNHWKTLSASEQAEVKRKYASWSTMSEEEKQKLRARLEKFKALSEPEKANVLDSMRTKEDAKKGAVAK